MHCCRNFTHIHTYTHAFVMSEQRLCLIASIEGIEAIEGVRDTYVDPPAYSATRWNLPTGALNLQLLKISVAVAKTSADFCSFLPIRLSSPVSMARWRGLALVVCCQTLLFATAHARFVIEQGGLQIRLPAEAKKAHPNGFDMSLANFGAPKYGGDLLYVPSLQNVFVSRQGCDHCSPKKLCLAGDSSYI